MKLIAATLLTALAGFATTTARADHSRVNVAVGINVGPTRPAPVYVNHAPVYVAPAPVYVAPAHRHERGHWENVTVKTWVPARWITTHDRRGRPVRVLEKGYFAYHTDRVWVAHRGHNDRDDRYSHSYRNDGWRR